MPPKKQSSCKTAASSAKAPGRQQRVDAKVKYARFLEFARQMNLPKGMKYSTLLGFSNDPKNLFVDTDFITSLTSQLLEHSYFTNLKTMLEADAQHVIDQATKDNKVVKAIVRALLLEGGVQAKKITTHMAAKKNELLSRVKVNIDDPAEWEAIPDTSKHVYKLLQSTTGDESMSKLLEANKGIRHDLVKIAIFHAAALYNPKQKNLGIVLAEGPKAHDLSQTQKQIFLAISGTQDETELRDRLLNSSATLMGEAFQIKYVSKALPEFNRLLLELAKLRALALDDNIVDQMCAEKKLILEIAKLLSKGKITQIHGGINIRLKPVEGINPQMRQKIISDLALNIVTPERASSGWVLEGVSREFDINDCCGKCQALKTHYQDILHIAQAYNAHHKDKPPESLMSSQEITSGPPRSTSPQTQALYETFGAACSIVGDEMVVNLVMFSLDGSNKGSRQLIFRTAPTTPPAEPTGEKDGESLNMPDSKRTNRPT